MKVAAVTTVTRTKVGQRMTATRNATRRDITAVVVAEDVVAEAEEEEVVVEEGDVVKTPPQKGIMMP